MDIARLRKEANLSLEELAARMGKSLNTIRNWENGKYKPDRGNIALLRAIFRNRNRRRR